MTDNKINKNEGNGNRKEKRNKTREE